jgi:hypothetical protein
MASCYRILPGRCLWPAMDLSWEGLCHVQVAVNPGEHGVAITCLPHFPGVLACHGACCCDLLCCLPFGKATSARMHPMLRFAAAMLLQRGGLLLRTRTS